jgi:hypothetical protein
VKIFCRRDERIDVELWKNLHHEAVDKETAVQNIIKAALIEWLARHGGKPK